MIAFLVIVLPSCPSATSEETLGTKGGFEETDSSIKGKNRRDRLISQTFLGEDLLPVTESPLVVSPDLAALRLPGS